MNKAIGDDQQQQVALLTALQAKIKALLEEKALLQRELDAERKDLHGRFGEPTARGGEAAGGSGAGSTRTNPTAPGRSGPATTAPARYRPRWRTSHEIEE